MLEIFAALLLGLSSRLLVNKATSAFTVAADWVDECEAFRGLFGSSGGVLASTSLLLVSFLCFIGIAWHANHRLTTNRHHHTH